MQGVEHLTQNTSFALGEEKEEAQYMRVFECMESFLYKRSEIIQGRWERKTAVHVQRFNSN